MLTIDNFFTTRFAGGEGFSFPLLLVSLRPQNSGAHNPEPDIVALVARIDADPVGYGATRCIVVPTATATDAVRARSGSLIIHLRCRGVAIKDHAEAIIVYQLSLGH